MKGYCIVPAFELTAPEEPRVRACLTMIAALVCERLRANGDRSHHAIDWRDPGDAAWRGWTDDLAEPHLVPLGDPDRLMALVLLSVDPYSGQAAAVIRSIATCRAVTFGFDGQAYLCLRHEDERPVSPDPSLVTVSEWPGLLAETDYLDGWTGAPGRAANGG